MLLFKVIPGLSNTERNDLWNIYLTFYNKLVEKYSNEKIKNRSDYIDNDPYSHLKEDYFFE